MARINREDQLTFRTHIRSFIQRSEDPSPAYDLELFSLYGALGAFEQSFGSREGRYRMSSTERGRYTLVGETDAPPELGALPLSEGLPRETANLLIKLAQAGEKFTAQAIISTS